MAEATQSRKATLIIKNPAREPYTLEVDVSAKLGDVQRLLTERYEGHPTAAQQTLIYGGKVLKDANVTIQEVVGQHDSSPGPYNLHLVVKSPQAAPASPAPSAAPPSAVGTPGGQQAWPRSTTPAAASGSGASTSSGAASGSSETAPSPVSIPAFGAAATPAAFTTFPGFAGAFGAAATPAAFTTFPGFPGASAAPAAGGTTQQHVGGFPAPQHAYMQMNPIVSAAYQAAYNAALAVTHSVQTTGQLPAVPTTPPGNNIMPVPPPYMMVPMYYPSYPSPGMNLGPTQLQVFMQQAAAASGAASATFPPAAGAGGNVADSGMQQAQQQQNQRLAALQAMQAAQMADMVRAAAAGGGGGLIQRRRAAGAAGGVAGPRRAGGGLGLGREVRRVFTLRIPISARTLLQALVFAVVLYQRFTWKRTLALLVGGAVLYLTAVWGPLRRVMVALMQGPRTAQQAGAHVAPAAQPRRGVLMEILVFILGFITSLLPAWNYNPEDAAAFAVAQDMVAQEARAQQPPPGEDAGVLAGGADGADAPAPPAAAAAPAADDAVIAAAAAD